MNLFITYNQPFSFSKNLLNHFRGYEDCLHEIDSGKMRKALYIEDELVLLEMRDQPEKGGLSVSLLGVKSPLSAGKESLIRQKLNRLFDLDRKLDPFYERLTTFPGLESFPERYAGLKNSGNPRSFRSNFLVHHRATDQFDFCLSG